MNTLRGIFPEPPSIPRRNFIRENMLQIKRMQGVVSAGGDDSSVKRRNRQIADHTDPTNKTMKLIRTTKKQLQNLAMLSNVEKHKTEKTVRPEKKGKCDCKTAIELLKENTKKFKEIGIQTENISNYKQNPESVNVIYSRNSPRNIGDGDKSKRKSDHSPEKSFDEKKLSKSTKDPMLPPANYQKGVVPKYLKDRKDEILKSNAIIDDERCPEGHVVLPENERKETLRMLRQSYSELVSELNQMPVRSDTLKIRNRKIEIENQLKKLDEGIKVFTRPKVYVKIGA